MSDFWDLFQRNFLLHNALMGSLAVGLFCPIIGAYFILRRMVLMAVALPQVSAAGLSLALLFQGMGFHWALHPGEAHDRLMAFGFAMLATLATLFALAALERRGGGTTESRVGAVFAAAYALSILLVATQPAGRIEILNMLHGEVIAISRPDLNLLMVVFALLAILLFLFHRQFVLISFDREMAQAVGMRVGWWDALLYAVMGIALSVSVLIAGPMQTFAFLVIPPLAARRFVRRMGAFFALASLLGALSAFAGFYVAYHWDWPLGPSGILVASGVLVLASAAKALQIRFQTPTL